MVAIATAFVPALSDTLERSKVRSGASNRSSEGRFRN
jgi:hypothetical protein